MTLLDQSSFVMPGLNLSFQVIASLEACPGQGHTCLLRSAVSLSDEPWPDLMQLLFLCIIIPSVRPHGVSGTQNHNDSCLTNKHDTTHISYSYFPYQVCLLLIQRVNLEKKVTLKVEW